MNIDQGLKLLSINSAEHILIGGLFMLASPYLPYSVHTLHTRIFSVKMNLPEFNSFSHFRSFAKTGWDSKFKHDQ